MMNMVVLMVFLSVLLFLSNIVCSLKIGQNECMEKLNANLVTIDLPDNQSMYSALSYSTTLTEKYFLENTIQILNSGGEKVSKFEIKMALGPSNRFLAAWIVRDDRDIKELRYRRIAFTELLNITIQNIGENLEVIVNNISLGSIPASLASDLNPHSVQISGSSNITRICYSQYWPALDGCMNFNGTIAASGVNIPRLQFASGFKEGTVLSIKGLIKPKGKDFQISVLHGRSDELILQLQAVLNENKIVFHNPYKHKTMPNEYFELNRTVQIDIMRKDHKFWIHVNHVFLATYEPIVLWAHEYDSLTIAHLVLSGDFITESLCHNTSSAIVKNAPFDPSYMLDGNCSSKLIAENIHEMPHVNLPHIFAKNQSLFVYGKTYPFNDFRFSFYLNTPFNVLININFFMDHKKTYIGADIHNFTVIESVPLTRDTTFVVELANSDDGYKILVDGHRFATYENSMNPEENLSLGIFGDAQIFGVCLSKSSGK